jgi:uncharacterized protein (TIGR00290 family)
MNIPRRRAVMSWSSGKDSTFALHAVRQSGELEVTHLLTTVNEVHDRVAIHGVRSDILRAQAVSLGLPLVEVPLPYPCSNEVYEARMTEALAGFTANGITDYVFGDLFLEDVRGYRDAQLAKAGLTGHYPLWGRDTRELSREMIAAGLVANLTTLDPKCVPKHLCGSNYDWQLLDALPASIDPCGENGEFHTLVSDGPGFSKRLRLAMGETIEREGFVYADFLLAPAAA